MSEIKVYPYVCGYCDGWVIYSQENLRYEHAEDGERVKADSPGDFVSAAHNRAGTPVNPADVIDSDEIERTYHDTESADLNDDMSDGFGNTFRETVNPDPIDWTLPEYRCESGGLEYTEVTDAAGYLKCGCHGSQRDHTCNEPDRESAMRAEGGYDI